MARLLKDTCKIAAEIIDGQHDSDLDFIAQACKARLKMRFRKGATVRLVGTKNAGIDGQIGTIIRVNQKSVAVGVGTPTTDEWGTSWSLGEYNVPPSMLEAVGVGA
jgi:hypothetical protein